MLTSLILIFSGFVLLFTGAEALVRGSVSFANRLKISPLIIGLTIVSFGTSMPELVVSVQAALQNSPAIAIGNVVGSNIFNIGIILGLASVIYPLKIKLQLVRNETPMMILVALVFWFMFRDFSLSRIEASVLIFLFAGYIFYNFRQAQRSDTGEIPDDISQARIKNIFLEIALIIAGPLILVLGANLLMDGSIQIARYFSVSEAVIGLTIVSAGTSLPELATSVVAAVRKQADIAVGNVVGSNIFNILGILGITALITPIQTVQINQVDIYVMLVFSMILLPFIRTHFELKRWEGSVLLILFLFYMYYLFTI